MPKKYKCKRVHEMSSETVFVLGFISSLLASAVAFYIMQRMKKD